mmetsp:Transcript_90646/g.210842  ORF Transcript_90646/g.210842 Transcript_90646/m.210842 type:complete len:241 (-) Transcript_90646:267-989(-)
MFTTRKGKSGSGQGVGAGRLSSWSTKISELAARAPLHDARKSKPSTTAESSLTGTSSTSSTSRKSGANLCAPPPAVKMRCGCTMSVPSSCSSASSASTASSVCPDVSCCCCRTSVTAFAIWAVAPEMKRSRYGVPSRSNSSSKSLRVRPVAPNASGKQCKSPASPRGSAKTIFTRLPPISTPLRPGAPRMRCTMPPSLAPRPTPAEATCGRSNAPPRVPRGGTEAARPQRGTPAASTPAS